MALVGLGILIVLVAIAIVGPIFMPFNFQLRSQSGPGRAQRAAAVAQHLFGETGGLQRDVFQLVVNGARTSLFVGFSSMAIGVVLGTLVGSSAGYFGGRLDNILMRVVDVMLSLPLLFLILVASRFFGNGNVLLIVAIFGLFSWMGVARLVRSLFLSLREQEFVEAARAVGVGDRRIIFRAYPAERRQPDRGGGQPDHRRKHHCRGIRELPRLRDQLHHTDVGQHPNQRADLHLARQLVVAALPGHGDRAQVIAVNFVGDGLRDALDPRSRAHDQHYPGAEPERSRQDRQRSSAAGRAALRP